MEEVVSLPLIVYFALVLYDLLIVGDYNKEKNIRCIITYTIFLYSIVSGVSFFKELDIVKLLSNFNFPCRICTMYFLKLKVTCSAQDWKFFEIYHV